MLAWMTLDRWSERLWHALTFPWLNLGGTKLSVAMALGLGLGALLAWRLTAYIEEALVGRFFPRFNIESGRAFTLARVVRYLVLVAGGALSFHLAGVDLSGLAVMAGFLSIGVGFGLQNVTSNFIAGLIVLFERPIKPGDQIRVGERVGIVQDVRLRSTTIQTFDGLSIIVPNSEFISKEVINYSYGDLRIRLHLPMAFAMGTPTREAQQLLLDLVLAHEEVLKEPEPVVLLKGLGPNLLEFELQVWVANAGLGSGVTTELYHSILEAVAARGFALPMPQREVHLHPSSAWQNMQPPAP